MNNNKEITIETIEDAAKAFRDHEDICIQRVREWAKQFGKEHQKLVLKILKNINYYSRVKIRLMVNELVELISKQLQLEDVIFVPIGNPTEGSHYIARALRGVPKVMGAGVQSFNFENNFFCL